MELVIEQLKNNEKFTETAEEDLRDIAADKERMIQFRRILKKRLL